MSPSMPGRRNAADGARVRHGGEVGGGEIETVTAPPMTRLAQCVVRKLMRFRLIINLFLLVACSVTVLQLLVESDVVDEKCKWKSPFFRMRILLIFDFIDGAKF